LFDDHNKIFQFKKIRGQVQNRIDFDVEVERDDTLPFSFISRFEAIKYQNYGKVIIYSLLGSGNSVAGNGSVLNFRPGTSRNWLGVS
jgi:hypothetical protein